MLGVNGAGDSKGRVELYERGYGKDAAGIAKEAIAYGNVMSHLLGKEHSLIGTIARDNDFDIVLIDTAGRMQDNEVCVQFFQTLDQFWVAHEVFQPLMRALAKLVSVNNPDKILFVGEALVGNEAVDQLSKFDRALRDFSGSGGVSKGRGIDGMLVTKWDTVDDKASFLLC
jgi:signal recognition particle receptor subunit alpha